MPVVPEPTIDEKRPLIVRRLHGSTQARRSPRGRCLRTFRALRRVLARILRPLVDAAVAGFADKRRAVEIALREFTKMSSRAIAEMCGVSVDFVARLRQVSSDDTSPAVTGADGKQYPARREPLHPPGAEHPCSTSSPN